MNKLQFDKELRRLLHIAEFGITGLKDNKQKEAVASAIKFVLWQLHDQGHIHGQNRPQLTVVK